MSYLVVMHLAMLAIVGVCGARVSYAGRQVIHHRNDRQETTDYSIEG